MIQKRTIEGRWWLPGIEIDATAGTLEFDPLKGITLSLRRYLSRSMLEVFQSVAGQRAISAPMVIFGHDTSDNPITVHRCVEIASSNAGGMEGKKYIADVVYVGTHLLDPDQEAFGSVQLEFDYLYRWLGQEAKVTFAPKQEDWVIDERMELPQPFDALLPTHGKMQFITFGGPGTTAGMNERLDTTRWASHIWWQFHERIPVRALNDRIHALRRLLTLFVGQPVHLRACTLFRSCLGEPQTHDGQIDGGVEVLRARPTDPDVLREIWGSQFTVTFEEVRSDLAVSISRWFEYHLSHKTILDLYFSEFFGRHHPMEVRFLLLAQALEVYHGIGNSGQVEAKDTWKSRVKRIINLAPIDERKWLEEKLSHSNQKTLAQRLGEVVARLSSVLGNLLHDHGEVPHEHIAVCAYFRHERRSAVGDSGDAFSDWYAAETELHHARFCRRVKDTRNYFTHWGEDLGPNRIIQPHELPKYTERLERILQICILSDVGISGSWQHRIAGEPLPMPITYMPTKTGTGHT